MKSLPLFSARKRLGRPDSPLPLPPPLSPRSIPPEQDQLSALGFLTPPPAPLLSSSLLPPTSEGLLRPPQQPASAAPTRPPRLPLPSSAPGHLRSSRRAKDGAVTLAATSRRLFLRVAGGCSPSTAACPWFSCNGFRWRLQIFSGSGMWRLCGSELQRSKCQEAVQHVCFPGKAR
ncbi:protein lyl-1 [Triticum aestivum]|uniref:protein lyl-1 n=1 Tax=Triticum aestivum TaxID=4565 RepID=UPI001D0302A3|nr:protein lyl-1-like [Triticum aestivum]